MTNEELTRRIDQIHRLLHDTQGRDTWAWSMAIARLMDQLTELWNKGGK